MRLDGEMDAKEYSELKEETNQKLRKLEIERGQLAALNVDYSEKIDFMLWLLQNIDTFFNEANGEIKKLILRSIFPEKLIFDGNKYRTQFLNPAVALLSTEKTANKEEKHPSFGVLSLNVPYGLNFSNFIEDFNRIRKLKAFMEIKQLS
jgi:hypothetical protein